MNKTAHVVGGAIAGVCAVATMRHREKKPLRAGELVGAGCGGSAGGRIPDILEPATSSYHRGPAHSMVAAVGIGYTLAELLFPFRQWCDKKADRLYELAREGQDWFTYLIRWIAGFFFDFLGGLIPGCLAGFLSHIIMDSFTPRGIPVVGLSATF